MSPCPLRWHICVHMYIFNPYQQIFFTLVFRKSGKERGRRESERQREEHGCDKDTWIGCIWHVPWPGWRTKPATQVHDLAGNWTLHPSVSRLMLWCSNHWETLAGHDILLNYLYWAFEFNFIVVSLFFLKYNNGPANRITKF